MRKTYLVLALILSFALAIVMTGCGGTVAVDFENGETAETHGLQYTVPADWKEVKSNDTKSVYEHQNESGEVDGTYVVMFDDVYSKSDFFYNDKEDLFDNAVEFLPKDVELMSEATLDKKTIEDAAESYVLTDEGSGYQITSFLAKHHAFLTVVTGNISADDMVLFNDSLKIKEYADSVKVKSIDAEYEDEYEYEGNDVDEDSVTVNANYDDGTAYDISGWSFEGSTEVEVGTNTFTIVYDGCKCDISVEGKAEEEDDDDDYYSDYDSGYSSSSREKVTCVGCNGAGWVEQGGYWLDGEWVDTYVMECALCDGQGWYYEGE